MLPTLRAKTAALLVFSFSCYACYVYAKVLASRSTPALESRATPLVHVPAPQHNLAQYSPYFPVAAYQAPPETCNITQVHILQRHGARYPTSGAGAQIEAALAKLRTAKAYTDPRLAFLRNFTYDLGTNDLVAFGAAQSVDAGQEAFARYGHLVSGDHLPFVRASSSERVVLSATNWTAGFAAASKGEFAPVLSVILPESGNDTLDDNMCPAAGSSDPQTNAWLAVFAPRITEQLNAGAPGANVSDTDTFNLISLCPFETVAHGVRSQFCGLFESMDAFPGFEYSGDLNKYYGTGYGQPLGRVQGVGYVNELLARLTGTPVHDHTQTNQTLDASPATFPLDRSLYADFSHDNQMAAIYAALGLFPEPVPLDPTKPDPARAWWASRLVPFSARMVVEKLECVPGEDEAGRVGEHVRILVNDALQPLEFCGASADGLCALDAFVESQAYARSDGGGDWEKCFE
ncbi:hypothetical protein CERSUDRAFT_79948 [Gelatoporia subvermispora B]|uniref:Phytase A n=1 Tax=Ceriporiopsis subvermispora (strain B) TaxID=914234 RepID=M2RN29_CERS8|nr:hypothetical protein CERSUDRAFT_79948 [Gelatoporia subvermispora B]